MTPAVTQAQLTRVLKAMAAAGTPARGVRCLPTGAVEVLTEAAAPAPLAANDEADWTELAGDEARAAKGT